MPRWWKQLWKSDQGGQSVQARPMERLEDRRYLAGLTFNVSDAAIYEGNAGEKMMVFTIALSGLTASGGRSVRYSTQTGTATGGQDYRVTSGQVFFAAGVTTRTVSVPIFGDTVIEPHEQFTLNLSNPVGGDLGRATGIGTIGDDDAPIVIVQALDAKAAEKKQDPGIFRITRSGATTSPLKVFYTVAGTASKGVDYTKLKGTVIIPTGKSFVDINVIPLRDALAEGPETVVLKIKPRLGYQVGQASNAVINIADAPRKKSAARVAADNSVLA